MSTAYSIIFAYPRVPEMELIERGGVLEMELKGPN